MFDLMGFGSPVDSTPMLFLPGVLALAWGTAIRMMAAGLGIEVDEIVEFWEAEPAPETYDIAAGRIEKRRLGTIMSPWAMKRSKSREALSAQCRSSSTSTTGAARCSASDKRARTSQR
jgi:hypothetical protein